MTRTGSFRFGANPEARLRLLLGGAWRQVRIRHPSANTFLRGPFYREKARIRHSLPNKFLRGPFYLARKYGGAPNVTSRPSYPAVQTSPCMLFGHEQNPFAVNVRTPLGPHARNDDSPCLIWSSQQCSHQVTVHLLGDEQESSRHQSMHSFKTRLRAFDTPKMTTTHADSCGLAPV